MTTVKTKLMITIIAILSINAKLITIVNPVSEKMFSVEVVSDSNTVKCLKILAM